jgi:hypothetical protein
MTEVNGQKDAIRPLKNEEEIFSIPIEKPTFQLSLKGLDLPDDSKSRLESEIRQKITEEMDKVRENQLRESVSSTNEMDVNISLQGLDLPVESKSRLESEIKSMMGRYISSGGATEGSDSGGGRGSCICGSSGLPGRTYGLPSLTKPTQSDQSKVLALYFAEDVLRLNVYWGGADAKQNEMWISMTSAPNVTWRKEIIGWNLCRGGNTLFYTESANHGSLNVKKIRNDCSGTDTLVFAKAKAFGVLTPMYNFDISQFWRTLGGCRLHFYWYSD